MCEEESKLLLFLDQLRNTGEIRQVPVSQVPETILESAKHGGARTRKADQGARRELDG